MISLVPTSEQPFDVRTTTAGERRRALRLADSARTPEGEDDYAQRMRVNLFAAIALVTLVGVGIWLANAMVNSEKSHGCFTSGQHTCSLI